MDLTYYSFVDLVSREPCLSLELVRGPFSSSRLLWEQSSDARTRRRRPPLSPRTASFSAAMSQRTSQATFHCPAMPCARPPVSGLRRRSGHRSASARNFRARVIQHKMQCSRRCTLLLEGCPYNQRFSAFTGDEPLSEHGTAYERRSRIGLYSSSAFQRQCWKLNPTVTGLPSRKSAPQRTYYTTIDAPRRLTTYI